jgi:proteasome lid subunit RPN8/RPN11
MVLRVSPERFDLPVVLIRPEAVARIYQHAADGLPDEVTGYIWGVPFEDIRTGQQVTYIEEIVSPVVAGSPSDVETHAGGGNHLAARRPASGVIGVGYYRSRPNLSAFQSATEVRHFTDFYPEEYQIAIMVDPTVTIPEQLDPAEPWIGFFAWGVDHKPERLPLGNVHLVQSRPERSVVSDEGNTEIGVTDGSRKQADRSESEIEAIKFSRAQRFLSLVRRRTHESGSSSVLFLTEQVTRDLAREFQSKDPVDGLLHGLRGSEAGVPYICVVGISRRTPRTSFRHFGSDGRASEDIPGIEDGLSDYAELWRPRARGREIGMVPVGLYGSTARLQRGLALWRAISTRNSRQRDSKLPHRMSSSLTNVIVVALEGSPASNVPSWEAALPYRVNVYGQQAERLQPIRVKHEMIGDGEL